MDTSREAILVTFPCIATPIFFATLVASAPKSISLICFSATVVLTSGLGYYLRFRNAALVKRSTESYQQFQAFLFRLFQPSSLDVALSYSTTIVYAVIMIIRLTSTDTFGGSPQNLDFGPKNGEAGEANLSMTKSSTTIGHCVQGFLASFLTFPAVTGSIFRLMGSMRGASARDDGSAEEETSFPEHGRGRTISCSFVTETMPRLLAASMTMYPSYSGIKRFVKDAETFSQTSHANNITEWLLGYFLGVGVGWFVTVLVQGRLLRTAGLDTNGSCCKAPLCCVYENDEEKMSHDESKILIAKELLTVSFGVDNDDSTYGFAYVASYRELCSSKTSTVVKIVSTLSAGLLILFSLSSLITGVLMGMTWHVNENAASEVLMIVSFVIIYVVVIAVGAKAFVDELSRA